MKEIWASIRVVANISHSIVDMKKDILYPDPSGKNYLLVY